MIEKAYNLLFLIEKNISLTSFFWFGFCCCIICILILILIYKFFYILFRNPNKKYNNFVYKNGFMTKRESGNFFITSQSVYKIISTFTVNNFENISITKTNIFQETNTEVFMLEIYIKQLSKSKNDDNNLKNINNFQKSLSEHLSVIFNTIKIESICIVL
jgi:hypothetical protein